MKPLLKRIQELPMLLRLIHDKHAQDLIEYALMAGFLAVAAGAIMPGVAVSIGQIWCKVWGVLINAAGGDVTPVGNCNA
jgi:Flp pilus assembly pilin Flp